MDKNCPPGALSGPSGILRFGPGQPILCVNDQCGYDCEQPEVLAELRAGRFDRLIASAQRGMAEGCPVYNVQLSTPALTGRERELVPAAVAAIYRETGCCIAVDSRDPETVELALAAYPHKALCNSVTGEWRNLETMLPIIARHGAAIGSALVYEQGIPKTVGERVAVGRRIVEAAEACGIDRRDVIIDAVCLPGAVTPEGMGVTLETHQGAARRAGRTRAARHQQRRFHDAKPPLPRPGLLRRRRSLGLERGDDRSLYAPAGVDAPRHGLPVGDRSAGAGLPEPLSRRPGSRFPGSARVASEFVSRAARRKDVHG